jgi:hypothetical protein
LLHGDVEPEFDTRCYDLHGHEKEQDCRKQRHPYKGSDQFGAKSGPYYLSFSIIDKLGDISQKKKYQKKKEEDIDIDEYKYQDCI